jgi:hypothetical protein
LHDRAHRGGRHALQRVITDGLAIGEDHRDADDIAIGRTHRQTQRQASVLESHLGQGREVSAERSECLGHERVLIRTERALESHTTFAS